MPLNDLADYSVDFFVSNINVTLLTRKEFPWGKAVPEDIFLHYVLPVRVNNENLDSWGGAFIFFRVGGTTVSPEDRQKLPFNSLFSDDSGLDVLHSDIKCNDLTGNSYPILLLVNKNGEIIFKSEGYRIRTGGQILQMVNSPR
jgi:hypothetical protein